MNEKIFSWPKISNKNPQHNWGEMYPKVLAWHSELAIFLDPGIVWDTLIYIIRI